MKFKRALKRTALIFLLLVLFMFANNSNLFTKERSGDPTLLAHVAMSQTYPMEGIQNDTCTAERIFEPEHPYIGNTIPSMEAAFEAGADVVELDIHPTKDGEFAVFHDWKLECRTDGKGVTRDHTMEELKKLDVGYGYTADNGKTYPFRGKGIGLMPTLNEVLIHFPDKEFLINIKSDDANEGVKLAEYLSAFPDERISQLSAYGGNHPIDALKKYLPNLRVMSMDSMKSCLIPYIAGGWTGYIPGACENTQLHIPEKIAPWLWGYPEKFLNRMDDSNTRVVLVAGNGGWSEGFDDKQDVERIPAGYNGMVWTNRVDIIAPIIK
ncbi:glycerophosphodiester phosphodiesterase [Mesobacillus campisalis]|uniref:Glycerophosphodiester phosphodiesterase n=1 Tax=Mesobacillus campisalis TaxID=1408103 RepID=A0A0M2T0C1_9BACI|nr:glycerophosphodiester phosphodiesterase family protein [Mesobacillus campisalis]KKK39853.1 glycerophosphodiester phosphodiesterase [Mesobacillus campisalis]